MMRVGNARKFSLPSSYLHPATSCCTYLHPRTQNRHLQTPPPREPRTPSPLALPIKVLHTPPQPTRLAFLPRLPVPSPPRLLGRRRQLSRTDSASLQPVSHVTLLCITWCRAGPIRPAGCSCFDEGSAGAKAEAGAGGSSRAHSSESWGGEDLWRELRRVGAEEANCRLPWTSPCPAISARCIHSPGISLFRSGSAPELFSTLAIIISFPITTRFYPQHRPRTL